MMYSPIRKSSSERFNMRSCSRRCSAMVARYTSGRSYSSSCFSLGSRNSYCSSSFTSSSQFTSSSNSSYFSSSSVLLFSSNCSNSSCISSNSSGFSSINSSSSSISSSSGASSSTGLSSISVLIFCSRLKIGSCNNVESRICCGVRRCSRLNCCVSLTINSVPCFSLFRLA